MHWGGSVKHASTGRTIYVLLEVHYRHALPMCRKVVRLDLGKKVAAKSVVEAELAMLMSRATYRFGARQKQNRT